MKVYLAGYNVDTTVLKELEEKTGKRDDLTPEVLSAAYARISRDPRPINEIREDARGEVERSRKSNTAIIFKMGHHSVAEHAIFNLDILGVSRFAMEELEKFRPSLQKIMFFRVLRKIRIFGKNMIFEFLKKLKIGLVLLTDHINKSCFKACAFDLFGDNKILIKSYISL